MDHEYLESPGAALDSGLSSLTLRVEDDQEGDGDEGAEEDGQVGGEGHLEGDGHGGEGLGR